MSSPTILSFLEQIKAKPVLLLDREGRCLMLTPVLQKKMTSLLPTDMFQLIANSEMESWSAYLRKSHEEEVFFKAFQSRKEVVRVIEGWKVKFREDLQIFEAEAVFLAESKEAVDFFNIFNGFINQGNKVIFVKNSQKRYVFANPSACRYFHKTKEEVIGKTDEELLTPEEAERCTQVDELVLNRKESIKFVGKVDENTELAIHKFYIPDAQQLDKGFIGAIIEDVSYLKNIERKLYASMNYVPGTLYIFNMQKDGSMKMEYISNKIFELTGFDAEAVMSDIALLFSCVFPQDEARLRQSIQEAFDKKKKWKLRFRLLHHQTNRLKWVRGESSPQLNNDGSITWHGIFTDITAEINKENRLKLLESVALHTKDAVCIAECRPPNWEDAQIIFSNQAFGKLQQANAKDTIGRRVKTYFSTKEEAAFTQEIQEKLERGENIFMELLNHDQNQQPYWAELSIIQFKHLTDATPMLLFIFHEITKQKNYTLQVERKVKRLFKAKLTESQEFFFISSHNLKAPISNMIGLLNLLQQLPSESEEQQKFIKALAKTTGQLDDTLNDLLAALKIKFQQNLVKSKVYLAALVHQVVDALPETEKNSFELHLDINENLYLNTFSSYLRYVLEAFLKNSLQFNPGEKQLNIYIEARIKGELLYLTYRDDGIGINVERYRDRLFGLYQIFHKKLSGKGVGLFNCKAYLEALNAEVDVQGAEGKGLAFVLKFNKD